MEKITIVLRRNSKHVASILRTQPSDNVPLNVFLLAAVLSRNKNNKFNVKNQSKICQGLLDVIHFNVHHQTSNSWCVTFRSFKAKQMLSSTFIPSSSGRSPVAASTLGHHAGFSYKFIPAHTHTHTLQRCGAPCRGEGKERGGRRRKKTSNVSPPLGCCCSNFN